ncbi:hypothetical protein P8452_18735 [Trifolium repens]|nr:hypothetical protein P8452_18735 [Trifolium repens]
MLFPAFVVFHSSFKQRYFANYLLILLEACMTKVMKSKRRQQGEFKFVPSLDHQISSLLSIPWPVICGFISRNNFHDIVNYLLFFEVVRGIVLLAAALFGVRGIMLIVFNATVGSSSF